MSAEQHLVPRRAAETVRLLLDHARIVAIIGPRQSGKSTLARMVAEAENDATYLTLDIDAVQNAAREDPDGFLAGQPRPLIIDEIQRAPELMLALKAAVDADPAPGQFLITGSADLPALDTLADTLPGRIDYVDLWPFTQRELTRSHIDDSFVDHLFSGDVPAAHEAPVGIGAYAAPIATGGFPEAVRRPATTRGSFFDGYVRSIVAHDVPTLGRRDPAVTRRILDACATNTANVLSVAGIARLADVDAKTAAAHLDLLDQLFLVRRLPSWSTNRSKRHVSAPKLHVSDSGLACHLAGVDEHAITPTHPLVGQMAETFVAMELLRDASRAKTRVRLHHFRDRDGNEVDVVLEAADGRVVGVEIKSGATARSPSFSGLRHLRKLAGDRFVAGVVLYSGASTLPFGDGMWAVPIDAMWRS